MLVDLPKFGVIALAFQHVSSVGWVGRASTLPVCEGLPGRQPRSDWQPEPGKGGVVNGQWTWVHEDALVLTVCFWISLLDLDL